MDGYSRLAKAAAWVALAAFVVGVIWYGIHSIHDDGKKVAWGECSKEQSDKDDERRKQNDEVETQKEARIDGQETALLGALSDEKKRSEDLERRYRAERDTNRGLWVTVKTIGDFEQSKGRSAESSGTCSSSTGRVELSPEDAENVRADYRDADKVVTQYETCRKTLIPLVRVLPETE